MAALQRKAELLAEADALQRRMKQSQLARWVHLAEFRALAWKPSPEMEDSGIKQK